MDERRSEDYLRPYLCGVVGMCFTKCQDWMSVTLEPDHVSQKIDILWQYQDRIRAIQVKSSENQISKAGR